MCKTEVAIVWTGSGRGCGARDALTFCQGASCPCHAWLLTSALVAVFLAAGCMGPAPKYEKEVGKGTRLWPLFENAYSEKGRETDILWPFFSFKNLTHSKYYGFRPFLMVKTDPEDRLKSLDALFPFFHMGSTGTRLEFATRPLLGVWRDPEKDITDVDVLFPFINYRSEPEKTRFHFRPLVWYQNTPKKHYFHLFPLYGENQEKYTVKEEDRERTVDRKRYFFLTPFFSYWRDKGKDPMDWSFNAFFPLTHFERKENRHSSWVLPLYYHKHSPWHRLTVVTPLYWDYARYNKVGDKCVETRMCFPFFGYSKGGPGSDQSWMSFGGNLVILENKEDAGSVNVLWPLFHYGWDPDYNLSWMFPLYGYYGSEKSSCLVVPPFYHYSHPESEIRNVGLWPLFGYYRKGSWRNYSTLYPFFQYAHDDRAVSWDFLFPFIAYSRRDAVTHSRFFPFYLHWDYPYRETRYLHLLWPLMRYKSRGDDTHFRLLFPYMTYQSNPEGHDFRVFWKWIQSTRNESMQTFVFNPFYRQESNSDGDHYWSVLGGLVSRKAKAESVNWTLFWFLGL